jgi:hypothetical protein
LTLENFKRKLAKKALPVKITFSIISVLAVIWGGYMLFDTIKNPYKYDSHTPMSFFRIFYVLIFIFGLNGYRFLKRRYLILSLESTLEISKKEEIVLEVIKKLGEPYFHHSDSYYEIGYSRVWYSAQYNIFINVDKSKFYLNVQGYNYRMPALFIDLGGAEVMRVRLMGYIKELTHLENEPVYREKTSLF